jgi:hypothetical protein
MVKMENIYLYSMVKIKRCERSSSCYKHFGFISTMVFFCQVKVNAIITVKNVILNATGKDAARIVSA